MNRPLQIFCCYAREDQLLLLMLKRHLSTIQRAGLIALQADIDISPGEEWEQKIGHYLNTAHMILLLISADFLSSDYCYAKEMMRALERHDAGEARVIPIILRPTSWRRAPFGKLQVLPANAEPVNSKYWHTLDDAFFDVTKGIEKAAEELSSESLGEISAIQPIPIQKISILAQNTAEPLPGQEASTSQTTLGISAPPSTKPIDEFTTPRIAEPIDRDKTAWLQFLTGHQRGHKFSIGTRSTSPIIITIGSEQANSVVIDDPTVFPHHATIFVRNGELSWCIEKSLTRNILEKLTIKNILTVNRQNVQQSMVLHDGDEIGIGPYIMLRWTLE